jgi:thymidylate synthase (FAD)
MKMMDNLKDKYLPVLDYGFVALKDWMGDDAAIAEMARNSYKLGTKSSNDDRGLIRHLLRNRHTSPFERCEIVLHCGMPIFVARQWVRHRTASLNEHSGRYSIMPLLFYTPEYERCKKQSTTNKQGSDSNLCFDKHGYSVYKLATEERRVDMCAHYDSNIKMDMARELARIDLPLSTYTYWYWKIDLHNLLHFLSLRLAPDAQWEIRQYAKVIASIVKLWLPITWQAFEDYQLHGVYLSRGELKLIRHLNTVGNRGWEINTLNEAATSLGMTRKETAEFRAKWCSLDDTPEEYNLDLSTAKDASYFEKLAEDSVVTT